MKNKIDDYSVLRKPVEENYLNKNKEASKAALIIISIISIALIICLGGLNLFQYKKNNTYKKSIEEYKRTNEKQSKEIEENKLLVQEKESEIKVFQDNASDANEEMESLQTELDDNKSLMKTIIDEDLNLLTEKNFWDEHAVIINISTGIYHKYDCDGIDWDAFLIYNTESADYEGYKPCSKCIK